MVKKRVPQYIPILGFLLFIFSCDKSVEPVIIDNTKANSFLSDKNYDKLIVEIQYVDGFPPTAEAINNLQVFLQQRLNKSGGISIVQNSIASPGQASYSIADIKNIENAHRTMKTNDKTLTAYFVFVDGDYSGNSGSSKVLGIAYGTSSMVIFEKTIRAFSGGITQPPVKTLETTVMFHEFGHILGLVNNGTSMQMAHQDEPNGHHCSDKNCLMYYTAETSDIIANISGGTIPSLDTNCLNDLKAGGGK